MKIDIKGCQVKRMYPLGYKVSFPRGRPTIPQKSHRVLFLRAVLFGPFAAAVMFRLRCEVLRF